MGFEPVTFQTQGTEPTTPHRDVAITVPPLSFSPGSDVSKPAHFGHL